MSGDFEDLGTFVVTADASTRFIVDGAPCEVGTALERYNDLWGFTRLVVVVPGKLASMEFGTRDTDG